MADQRRNIFGTLAVQNGVAEGPQGRECNVANFRHIIDDEDRFCFSAFWSGLSQFVPEPFGRRYARVPDSWKQHLKGSTLTGRAVDRNMTGAFPNDVVNS
jgi:hypothetical protein